jgi:hypothetical protein
MYHFYVKVINNYVPPTGQSSITSPRPTSPANPQSTPAPTEMCDGSPGNKPVEGNCSKYEV